MSTLLNYNDTLWKPYKSFKYTGEPQEFTLEPGTYLLECNGARPEGNVLSDTNMQFGGKALGILTLEEEQTLYACVGGNGHYPADSTERGTGGWNGGGDGAPAKYNVITQNYAFGCGGGGASDIRLSLPTTASSSYVLPEEYDELAYVMSDGQTGHFIDTGYKHCDKTKIEMVYEASGENPPGASSRGGTTKSEALFGARGLATTVNVFNSFGAYIYFNASNSYYNVIGKSISSSGSTVDPVYNKKILVKMDIDNCSWTNFETGELIRNNSFGYKGQLTRSESNMYIFDINSGNSTYADSPSYVKMYSFKIYENGRIIHCYIPAQSKSDPTSKGIYDVIGETFIPFEYGTYGDVLEEKSTIIDEYEDIHTSEVEFNVPDEYTEHEWLHMSDDTTPICIPINYMVSPGSKVSFDIDIESRSSSGWENGLMGAETSGRGRSFSLHFGSDNGHMQYMVNGTANDVGEFTTGHFIYELENGVGYKKYNPDGTLVTSTSVTSTAYPVHPISIWGLTTDASRKTYSRCKGKMYSFTAWDSINGTQEIVRKLVPVSLKSDPTIYGMYDIMQRIFYRYDNLGTQYSEPLGPEVEEGTVVTKSITYTDSLMSRIIVAGGAGGKSRSDGSANGVGFFITTGNGGGKVGGPSHQTNRWFGKAANQFEGGEFGTGITPESLQYTGAVQSWSAEGAAGGGGGWFGGYAITYNSVNMSEQGLSTNGGGGSGHINEDDHILDIYSQLNPDLLNYKLANGKLITRAATDPSIIIYKETQKVEAGDMINCEFEARPEKLKLPPGIYDIDCYGGDGSFRWLPNYCGRGGYTHARFTNLSTKMLYARVAGNGFHGSIYQLENYDYIGWNGAKHQENGDIRYSSGGGASDVRLYEDTLYHRILVAGGAGGAGQQQSIGGGGGGTTGGEGTGGCGTRPGPGTQTSSPYNSSYPSICGSFGFGGNGAYYRDGFGGAGGAGWFGGSGVYPDSSGDDELAGSGGSGYVLTESSYKPSGYMITDSEDYLTNGTMTTGGNTLPRGFSKIVFNCRKRFNSAKILCSDTNMSEFYKYNSTLNVWEIFESEGTDTPTDAEFEEYGTDDIYTDEGLPNQYKILFEVPSSLTYDQIPNVVEVNVTPNGQYISCNVKRDIDVTKIMKYKYIDTTRNPIEEGGEQPWDKTATFDAVINIDHIAPDIENPLNAYDYDIDIRHLVDPITSESYIRINSYVDRIDADTNQSFKMFKIVIG